MKSIIFHHEPKSILQEISALRIITNMALTQDHSLIPKLCYLSGASNSDVRILSTWQKKTSIAINSCVFLGLLSLCAQYYSSSSASKGKQKSSVSHCWTTIARQRNEFASETSIWPCLTASNHEIHHLSSWALIYSAGDLHAQNNNKHGADTWSFFDT